MVCQSQRRAGNRKRQLATDAEYLEVCRESSRKWRASHPDYFRQYRAAKPEKVEQNRAQQSQRDQRHRLAGLANNNSALDLKSCAAGIWLIQTPGSALANNNLAQAQVFIIPTVSLPTPPAGTSCKQQLFGDSARDA